PFAPPRLFAQGVCELGQAVSPAVPIFHVSQRGDTARESWPSHSSTPVSLTKTFSDAAEGRYSTKNGSRTSFLVLRSRSGKGEGNRFADNVSGSDPIIAHILAFVKYKIESYTKYRRPGNVVGTKTSG